MRGQQLSAFFLCDERGVFVKCCICLRGRYACVRFYQHDRTRACFQRLHESIAFAFVQAAAAAQKERDVCAERARNVLYRFVVGRNAPGAAGCHQSGGSVGRPAAQACLHRYAFFEQQSQLLVFRAVQGARQSEYRPVREVVFRPNVQGGQAFVVGAREVDGQAVSWSGRTTEEIEHVVQR